MPKKHTSLSFFPEESTVAVLTFGQNPLITLRTLDCLAFNRHFLKLDQKIYCGLYLIRVGKFWKELEKISGEDA